MELEILSETVNLRISPSAKRLLLQFAGYIAKRDGKNCTMSEALRILLLMSVREAEALMEGIQLKGFHKLSEKQRAKQIAQLALERAIHSIDNDDLSAIPSTSNTK